MRKIKFRGRKIDKDEWVYGYLVKDSEDKNLYEIISYSNLRSNTVEWSQIRPESEGQYTGIKDKNGKEIYEGDIISRCGYKNFHKLVEDIRDFYSNVNDYEFPINLEEYEIIGNIYENPELLK